MTSPSSSIAGPSSETPLSGVDFGLSCAPSSSSMIPPNPIGGAAYQMLHFSSGNPMIEETRGVMHLFPHDSPVPPVGRKPLVCVLGVPIT
ncbi:hypothetical protein MLD38_004942 [Melastoma candidum]|uniref:Uncharacterized protein n=1 Tax=Melastoma candidum TaxID=119954 RepID=A0ACB9SFX4_9MYRT|nr:hypothetical protein MLD38_004942 [Melastoma candidum]